MSVEVRLRHAFRAASADQGYLTHFSQTATFVTNNSYATGRGRAFTLRWQGSF